MRKLAHPFQVLFSELAQRSLDASFSSSYDPYGRFISAAVKGRRYWYFDTQDHQGRRKRSYVGPMDDTEITKRVEAFRELKDDIRARRKMVSALVNQAGLPKPDRTAGDIVEALAHAGFFRMRGVLVGSVAFQTYSALLGAYLPEASMMTGDADFAQFHSISVAIGDAMPPILDILEKVDPSFEPIPHVSGKPASTRFVTSSGFKVEFLTPNRGPEAYNDRPARMPALGGAAAQPLRFLDFLIFDPRRTVMLHRAGIPVNVPAPERYAVHKLIVSTRRKTGGDDSAKSRKDLWQAQQLMEAMIELKMNDDLADVFAEAMDRGPSWRAAISSALRRLPAESGDKIIGGIGEGLKNLSMDPEKYLPRLPGTERKDIEKSTGNGEDYRP
ncbi:hypothetical protein EV663_105160 [Rhodovulum bhavnagarense]|uniref:Nucleotidyltransferase-like domain-containing protein n=1 Tax=Rhodovulum bhavnagarense TaxID=992286 RepID=A0A4R2RDC6_9RHOB|nr:GSU2403 family nucleotidyltransferase fold protein [Rhodovulum bhavnagarense]TCP61442.1 hypothetical protein EV663_105160 [Rhodovulum bhavnagarense]